MSEFLKTLRIATYVCVLPLLATAAASAHHWLLTQNTGDIESVELVGSPPLAENSLSFIRNQVVRVSAAGQVDGRLWAADTESGEYIFASEVDVRLFKAGTETHTTVSAESGRFEFSAVEPGSYSLIATAPTAVTAFGIQVVAADDTSVAEGLSIEAVMVAPEISAAKSIIDSYRSGQAGDNVDDRRPKQVGTRRTSSMGIGANQVMLTLDGTLRGQIVSFENPVSAAEFAETTVFLLDGDQKIGEAEVGSQGEYQIAGVEPGFYDLIAAGPAGFAAVRFEAVAGEADTSTTAKPNAVINAAGMPLVQQLPLANGNFGFGSNFVYDRPVFSNPVGFAGSDMGVGIAAGGCGCGPCCGGVSGGFGGGGGGGLGGGFGGGGGLLGGGGGLRRALLLGGIGAGIAIPLAISGGNDTTTPTPVSPSQ